MGELLAASSRIHQALRLPATPEEITTAGEALRQVLADTRAAAQTLLTPDP